jgi:hypothetical protein
LNKFHEIEELIMSALNMDRLDPNSPHFEKQSKAQNRMWAAAAARGPQGLHKLSALHESQLDSYLREACVMDKVLPPSDIGPEDCEVGTDNDTLFYRLHFTFETRAYLGSFEATPQEVQEVYIPRIFLSFYLLTTPTYVLNDYNVQAYPFPVAKQVEDSIGMDMQEAKDWSMVKTLEDTIQASRSTNNNVLRGVDAQADIEANGVRGADAVAPLDVGKRFKIQREDFTELKKYFATRRSRLDRMVLPESDFIDLERFDSSDFGDQLMGQVVVDGYTVNQMHGVKFIRTIKIDSDRGDVFKEGNIYGFAAPSEVGRNFSLRGLKFYLDRDHQFLKFDAQMAIGHLWAVSAKIAKLELYNGGLNIDNSTYRNRISGTVPNSDALWGDPEYVVTKDYYNIDDAFHRPTVSYT